MGWPRSSSRCRRRAAFHRIRHCPGKQLRPDPQVLVTQPAPDHLSAADTHPVRDAWLPGQTPDISCRVAVGSGLPAQVSGCDGGDGCFQALVPAPARCPHACRPGRAAISWLSSRTSLGRSSVWDEENRGAVLMSGVSWEWLFGWKPVDADGVPIPQLLDPYSQIIINKALTTFQQNASGT